MRRKDGQKRNFFSSSLNQRQREMRERLTGSGEIQDNYRETNPNFKRAKAQCPVCFLFHSEDIPDNCWKTGLTTNNSWIKNEFTKYVYDNKKGKIV